MARRGRGEGSVFKLGDGTWAGVLSLGVVGDKRVRRTVKAADKATVLQRLRELRAQVEAGTKGPDETPVADYLNRWYAEVVCTRRRPNTQRQYESMIRLHAIPSIGRIKLGRLTAQHINGMLVAMEREGYGPTIRRMTRSMVAAALEQAVRWELIDRNPARHVDPPAIPERQQSVWNSEQLTQFWNVATSDKAVYALFRTAVGLGMRSGELRALQWSDVDMAAGTITVRATVFKPKGLDVVLQPPKTKAGVRVIHMPDSVAAALKQHKVWLLERGMTGLPMVFPSDTGRYISNKVLQQRFYRLCDKAELPRIRVHDLRHTSATLLLQAGVHPKIVSERLGHSNIGITLDLYSHVTPKMDQEAASKLDDLMGGKS